MTTRIVIGQRANGDSGIFVSPPGVDADTAADSALVLNVSAKVSQMILMGRLGAGTYNVPLGLTHPPYVFVTSQWDWAGVVGHTLGPGPFRPSPPFPAAAVSKCIVNGSGASVDIYAGYSVVYQVYSQAYA